MLNDKESVEQRLAQLLSDEVTRQESADEEARRKLSPRYEIRVRTEREPIAEETKQFRKIAKEVDDRYDQYSDD